MTKLDDLVAQREELEKREAVRISYEKFNAENDEEYYDQRVIDGQRHADELESIQVEDQIQHERIEEGLTVSPMDAYRGVTLPHHVDMALHPEETFAQYTPAVQELIEQYPQLGQWLAENQKLVETVGPELSQLIAEHPKLQEIIAPEVATTITAAEPAAIALGL